MITITEEFAGEIKDILEKLKGSDGETERRRVDMIDAFNFFLKED